MKIKSITNGVFTNVNKGGIYNSFTQFAQLDSTLDLNMSEDTKSMVAKYESDAGKIEKTINRLALMEDIIMLMRARDNVSNVRLFTIRTYIYARATCYRSDTINQEIRAIVGSTITDGTDMESLTNTKDFMDNAIKKLKTSISELIDEKMKMLNNSEVKLKNIIA